MNKEIEKLLKEKENIDKNIARRERRKKEIDKLIEELQNKKWKPKTGEYYYYINGILGVLGEKNLGCLSDADRFSIGNYFKTKEEAEFEVERLKVLEELKEFSYEFSDNEWENIDIKQYLMCYSYSAGKIDIVTHGWDKHNEIYFKTKEDAKKAIEKIGEDRLKKYYFKVGK